MSNGIARNSLKNNVHRVVPDEWVPSSRPQRTTSAAGGNLITQRDLAEFQRLKREQDDANERYESKREELITAWSGGATVENGPLRLCIDEVADQRITAQSLKPLLGDDEVQALRRQVVPTIYFRVKVSPAG